MKLSWILWTIVSVTEIALLIGISIFLWQREVDGAGVLQTPEIKLINIGVLLAFFIIPIVIQCIWLVVNIIVSNKKSNYQYAGD
ncbi:DUF3923 family protein [Corticicoccus populi]|uniref:DUF3923 family protein n=1 Tax=Corticicoccus populi TaxID=1812821 RepID=A0ABW5WS71_9STAP